MLYGLTFVAGMIVALIAMVAFATWYVRRESIEARVGRAGAVLAQYMEQQYNPPNGIMCAMSTEPELRGKNYNVTIQRAEGTPMAIVHTELSREATILRNALIECVNDLEAAIPCIVLTGQDDVRDTVKCCRDVLARVPRTDYVASLANADSRQKWQQP